MRKRRSALGNLIARQAAILLKVLFEGDSHDAWRHSKNNLDGLAISRMPAFGKEVNFYVLKVKKEIVEWVKRLVNGLFYREQYAALDDRR
jgi:hypothetical protein